MNEPTELTSASRAILAAIIIFTMSACGGGSDSSSANPDSPQGDSFVDDPSLDECRIVYNPYSDESGIVYDACLDEINAPYALARLQDENYDGYYREYFTGDLITLDGSGSEDSNGTIVSFSWSQISGDIPVNLASPTESETTFIAPVSMVLETYVFQLEVTDNDGLSDTSTVEVTIEPTVICATCTPDQVTVLLPTGNISAERYGRLSAIQDSMMAVANQRSNRIEFHDLATGDVVKEIQLNSAPDQLFFQSSSRLLYVSLLSTTAMSVINVDSDQIQTFQISGVVDEMTGSNERVYYSVGGDFGDKVLYSMDAQGNERTYGGIPGNLIAYNPNLNEIVNVGASSSSYPRELIRYGFNESGQMERRQTVDAESGASPYASTSFTTNLSISSDGQQMAIGTYSYTGESSNDQPILDIQPDNIQASNGAWLSDGSVSWVEFSPNNRYLVAVYGSFDRLEPSVSVYDAQSKVKLFDKLLPACRIDFNSQLQAGFTSDSRHIYTHVGCGDFDSTRSVISFTRLPDF